MARALLDALPAATLRLVTTRDETVARGLGCDNYSLNFMSDDEALDLLARKVGDLSGHVDAAKQIIAFCAGLPLAIELAAGLARTPADLPRLARRLESRGVLPQLTRFKGETRQDSVLVSFSNSYEELPDDGIRRRFRWLGAFAQPPATFPMSAAAALWEADDEDAAAETMNCLLERALVGESDGEYRLHGLVAEYAAGLLVDAGESDAARGRHAAIYLALASGLEDEDWELAEATMPQFRHGFDHGIAHEDTDIVSGYLGGLWHILVNRGLWDQHMQWRAQALALARDVEDIKAIANHLHLLAWTVKDQGDLDRALEYYEEALEIEETLGDRQGKAATLVKMATIYTVRGDLDRVLGLYEEALEIEETLGDRQGKAATLHSMANIYRVRGDLDRALGLYEEALSIDEALGDRHGKAATLVMSAQVYAERGEREVALRRTAEGAAILAEMRAADLGHVLDIIITYCRDWGPSEFDPLWSAVTGQVELAEWLTDPSAQTSEVSETSEV